MSKTDPIIPILQAQERDGEHQNVKDMEISQAMHIMRDWMSQSFRQSWFNRSSYFPDKTGEMEVRNLQFPS